jgi:hypothetical protein
LLSPKVTLWLKAVTFFSNNIFNLFLPKGNFVAFLFFVQSSLFHGYIHGSMITTLKTSIQFLSANSKLNGGIHLHSKIKVPNLLLRNGYKRTNWPLLLNKIHSPNF